MKLHSLLAVALVGAAALSQAAEINWAKDYDAAVKAAGENKLIMIDFYTDWCSWCKKLDAETYVDPKVVELSDKFVALKTDAEKEGADLASKYDVSGFPTILFVDGEGEVFGKLIGYRDAATFVTEVNGILAGHAEWPQIIEALQEKPDDAELNGKAAKAMLSRGDIERAEDYAKTAAGAGLEGDAMAEIYNGLGDHYQGEMEFLKAIRNFSQASQLATSPEVKGYALVSIMTVFTQMEAIGKSNKVGVAEELAALEGAKAEYREQAQKVLDEAKKPTTPAGAGS